MALKGVTALRTCCQAVKGHFYKITLEDCLGVRIPQFLETKGFPCRLTLDKGAFSQNQDMGIILTQM